MNRKIKMAAEFVDDVLSRPFGDDLMHIGGIYYSLFCVSGELENPLTKDELLKLTERVYEACRSSAVPVLTAERADAVCFMLEYGISCNRSPEFTSIGADQARKLLLSCDMEVFTDLVDAVAVDGHDYYSSDFDLLNSEFIGRINVAIDSVFEDKPKLEDAVRAAEQAGADRRGEPESELPVGRIWDETNELYF